MVNRSKSSINYTSIKNTKEYYYSIPNKSTCITNGTEVNCYSGIVCEGNSTVIACPSNSNIVSGEIKYGRWENQECKGQSIPAGPNSKNYSIPTSCIGKNSCTIDKTALTEDPVPGISKEFQVRWTCPNNQMPSASAAPLPPPKKPTKNFTYDFYFDINITKPSFVDNCIKKTINMPRKMDSLTWDGGSSTKIKGGSFNKSVIFPNKDALVPPDNTWFTGWNISNVIVRVGGGNDSWCHYKGQLKSFNGHGSDPNQAPLQQCNGDQCINWTGWKWNPKGGNDNCPCSGSNNTQEMRSDGSYDAYQPTSKYWYSSANIIPDFEPTVYQIIPLDNQTYPQIITYKVTYTIGFPNLITADELNAFITKVGQMAFTALAIGKSSEAAQKLVLDYCNNNGDSVTTTICKPGLNVMELFVNSAANPLPKYGCDISYTNCQQGWMNYCDDPNSFTSTACQNFYASSYTPTATINANVQALLQRNCAKTAVTNNVVNSPLSPDLQSVCGCYFPQAVYDNFKSSITKNNPGLSSFFSTPQCYYPMCNTNLSLQPNKAASAVCPSNTITQCITNTTNNLNAGGNISNVQVQNNAVQNCAASSTSGASAKAESTPVSSKGAASPAAPEPAAPAPSPAAPAPAAPSPAAPAPAAPAPAPEKGGLCIIL